MFSCLLERVELNSRNAIR